MPPESQPDLQIVIPVYNPHGDWAQGILDGVQGLESEFPALRIALALVEDGSSSPAQPAGLELLKGCIPAFQYFHYPENKGKGYALRHGFSQTLASHYLYTDIDFPYTLESMKRLIDALLHGTDITLGVRDKAYYSEVPLKRMLLSRAARLLLRGLLRIPVTDTQGGLKGFSAKGKSLFLQTKINRFLFDMEFVQLAFRQKELRVEVISVEARKGLVFTKFRIGLILNELVNFARLIRPFSK